MLDLTCYIDPIFIEYMFKKYLPFIYNSSLSFGSKILFVFFYSQKSTQITYDQLHSLHSLLNLILLATFANKTYSYIHLM